MAARTLHVALEFDLFTRLSGSPQSLAQVAQAIGLAERAASRLLRACTALGLVRAEAGTYTNTPASDKYLVRGRPTYIGSYVHLFDDLAYHRWGQMGHALRHNRPVEALDHPYRYFDTEAEDAKRFLSAQHDGSTSLGYALARRFDFSPFACLLDLGGGTGTYSIEILKRYPHLKAIIFDFPAMPIAASMSGSSWMARGGSTRGIASSPRPRRPRTGNSARCAAASAAAERHRRRRNTPPGRRQPSQANGSTAQGGGHFP
jgi:hypothetical protein